MPKPFHVPICRQDRSTLTPDIAAAFDAAYAALGAAMDVCARGIELGRVSPTSIFFGEAVEDWWEQVSTSRPSVAAARRALKPVHAKLTLAQQSAKGEPLPAFAGTSGDCAHDVAVTLAGDVESICITQHLGRATSATGDDLADLRRRRLLEEKLRQVLPHLGRFTEVDGEKLVACMWVEACVAAAGMQPLGSGKREGDVTTGAAAPVGQPGGYMSIRELCQHFSIPDAKREAYAKRLGRLRATSADAALYRESEPDAPRDAKYLYNAADARVRKTSYERPTK